MPERSDIPTPEDTVGEDASLPAQEPLADDSTPTITAPARRPDARRDVGTAWLVLLGLLLLAALPLAIDLYTPARFDAGEARAVNTAVETAQRKAGFDDTGYALEHWVPVYLGRLRPQHPPGATWLHVLVMPAFDRVADPADTATARARLATLAMTLLLVGAVFWAGHSINGLPTALFSALVALSMPALIFFGRLATAEVPTAAWTALAVAAALWAMRPLRRNPSLKRQFIGWLVCGLAIGMTVLTGGPLAMPTVVGPIIIIALICPHRLGHTLGVFAALALAVLLITPWSIHIHETNPEAWHRWADSLDPTAAHGGWRPYLLAVAWRLLAALAIAGPWLIWLVPALAQPFSTSTSDARPRMLLGWSWFLTTALLVACSPGEPRLRALIVVLPAAAVAIGQVIRQYHDLSAEGRHTYLWRSNRWLMVTLTAGLALVVPAWGYFQWPMPEPAARLAPWTGQLLAPMSLWFWFGLAIALLLTAGLGLRFSLSNHPGRAAGAWAVWVVIAACVLAIPLSRGEVMSTPVVYTQSP